MDSTAILELLEQLDDEIDDLEDTLEPVTKAPLAETASKLPLLDKAKLYVNVTYAIESIIFSYLRLHGVKVKEHPIFKELTRVKQYFDKLKVAENPVKPRENLALDKRAAARFITAGLRGNDQYDLARAEQQAKERAKAHIRFQDVSKKRKSESVEQSESEANKPAGALAVSETSSDEKEEVQKSKKQRKSDKKHEKKPKKSKKPS